MSDEDAIRRAVEDAVRRHLNQPTTHAEKPIIDERAVNAVPEGGTLAIPEAAIITPLAKSIAIERRVRFVSQGELQTESDEITTIAIGADHGGYAMKEMLKGHLQSRFTMLDCGTNSPESVDYPDFALKVAQLVSNGRAERGIMIDGAGIGSCMVANKVAGVRAAMCYNQATAVNSREHNNANVLTLGAGMIGNNLAKQIVDTWLATAFGGGRHARRVDKIMDVERRYRGS
ncbi:MAG: ribose 5-phosphate isomerase B [Chloroflexi bacterium]|nr:MAG: ribose 5-phosphate isomerase B [Chloroflexota bacterium]